MRRMRTALVLAAALALAAAVAATSSRSSAVAPTKLTLWVGFSARELGVVKSVVGEYDRKHADVEVKVVGGINDEKIVAAIRAGTAPDVVSSFNSYNVGSYCSTGGWIDLGPLMAKDHISVNIFPKLSQKRPTRTEARTPLGMPIASDRAIATTAR